MDKKSFLNEITKDFFEKVRKKFYDGREEQFAKDFFKEIKCKATDINNLKSCFYLSKYNYDITKKYSENYIYDIAPDLKDKPKKDNLFFDKSNSNKYFNNKILCHILIQDYDNMIDKLDDICDAIIAENLAELKLLFLNRKCCNISREVALFLNDSNAEEYYVEDYSVINIDITKICDKHDGRNVSWKDSISSLVYYIIDKIRSLIYINCLCNFKEVVLEDMNYIYKQVEEDIIDIYGSSFKYAKEKLLFKDKDKILKNFFQERLYKKNIEGKNSRTTCLLSFEKDNDLIKYPEQKILDKMPLLTDLKDYAFKKDLLNILNSNYYYLEDKMDVMLDELISNMLRAFRYSYFISNADDSSKLSEAVQLFLVEYKFSQERHFSYFDTSFNILVKFRTIEDLMKYIVKEIDKFLKTSCFFVFKPETVEDIVEETLVKGTNEEDIVEETLVKGTNKEDIIYLEEILNTIKKNVPKLKDKETAYDIIESYIKLNRYDLI